MFWRDWEMEAWSQTSLWASVYRIPFVSNRRFCHECKNRIYGKGLALLSGTSCVDTKILNDKRTKWTLSCYFKHTMRERLKVRCATCGRISFHPCKLFVQKLFAAAGYTLCAIQRFIELDLEITCRASKAILCNSPMVRRAEFCHEYGTRGSVCRVSPAHHDQYK
jgi:hypothetical protein